MNNGYHIIDADGHVAEVTDVWLPEPFLDPEYKDRAPRFVGNIRDCNRFLLEGHVHPKPEGKGCWIHGPIEGDTTSAGRPKGTYDPHARISDLDLEGIDVAVNFGAMIGMGCGRVQHPGLAVALARAYNDWVASHCNAYPKRLKAAAAMPMVDVEGAVVELERGVTKLGLVGPSTPPNSHGRNLDNVQFYPIYETCVRLDVPVLVHMAAAGHGGIDAAGAERFDAYFYTHAMGFTFELMTAFMCLTAGGVLDAFPKLRVAFLEAGCGWLPYWAERLDGHYEKLHAQVKAQRAPGEYLKGDQLFITCEPDEEILDRVVEEVGEDRILYASDYWHWDSKFPHTVEPILSRKDLTDTAKRKILGENAARLYKLNGHGK